jgi:hypothetical protein
MLTLLTIFSCKLFCIVVGDVYVISEEKFISLATIAIFYCRKYNNLTNRFPLGERVQFFISL